MPNQVPINSEAEAEAEAPQANALPSDAMVIAGPIIQSGTLS